MNNTVSPFAVGRQESDLPGVHPADMEELIHELRQPLSVIESITYYLELTVTDDKVFPHLQTIRSMLLKAHAILQRSSSVSDEFAMSAAGSH